MKRFIDFLIRCIALSGALTLGCGSNPAQPSQRTIVANLVIATGDGQTDTVMRTLPAAVTVQAKDAVGAPVATVVLNWFAVNGNGDTTFVGAGSTDATGGAKYRWTLGTRAGNQVLIAWALGPAGERVVYTQATATATADLAVTIATWDQPVLLKAGAFVLLSAHAGGNDRFGNYAGVPVYGNLSDGWIARGDTAWAPAVSGSYRLPLVLDQARGTLAVQVQQ